MIEAGSEPMKLEGERCAGFEHHVWKNSETGIVSKIPTESGEVWQVMTREEAERDLAIQEEFGVKKPVNIIDGPLTVEYDEYDQRINETLAVRERVKYLTYQPFCTPAHPVSYGELLHVQAIRDDFYERMQQREGIKRKHGLGLDLLGGQGFSLLKPALDPRVKAMRASLGNLLVAEADIKTNGHWAELTKESDVLVAKKGDVLLIDNRLMPIGKKMRRWRDSALAPIMRRNEEFQDAALWAVLEGLGANPNVVRPDERFDTSFKRLVRKITLHATPKMIAGAEAYA